jgi:hypothetical protein
VRGSAAHDLPDGVRVLTCVPSAQSAPGAEASPENTG